MSRPSQPLRLLIALALLLGAAMLALTLLQATDSALAIWERLGAMPAWMLGGYVVLLTQTDMSLDLYMQGVKDSVNISALLLASFKVSVFGFIVGAIGCASGLRTGDGPSAVGDAATSAVVTSIVCLIVADGVFAAIYYALGV